MNREYILTKLEQQRDALHLRFGVKSISLFGSVARGQATESSDVDVLIDVDRAISLFDLLAIQQFLEKALGVPKVDVVPRDCVYPELENSILSGAIHVP